MRLAGIIVGISRKPMPFMQIRSMTSTSEWCPSTEAFPEAIASTPSPLVANVCHRGNVSAVRACIND